MRALGGTIAVLALAVLAPGAAAFTIPPRIEGSPIDLDVGSGGAVDARVEGVAESNTDEQGTVGLVFAFPEAVGNIGAGAVWTNSFGDYGSDQHFFGSALQQSACDASTAPGNTCSYGPTQHAVGNVIDVFQTVTYHQGDRFYTIKWDVENKTGSPVKFRLGVHGASNLCHIDHQPPPNYCERTGSPLFHASPLEVGFESDWKNRAMSIVQSTPNWDHYQEGMFADIQERLGDSTPTGGLNNTLLTDDSQQVDFGVQWNNHYSTGLAANTTETYNATIKLPSVPLRVTPNFSFWDVGETAEFDVTTLNASGAAAANQTVCFSVAPAAGQPGTTTSGSVLTNGAGVGKISYAATGDADDIITAWLESSAPSCEKDAEESARRLEAIWFADGGGGGGGSNTGGNNTGGGGGAANTGAGGSALNPLAIVIRVIDNYADLWERHLARTRARNIYKAKKITLPVDLPPPPVPEADIRQIKGDFRIEYPPGGRLSLPGVTLSARKSLTVMKGTKAIKGPGRTTVTLKLTKLGRKYLRLFLSKSKRARRLFRKAPKATLTVTGVRARGNPVVRKATAKLKR